MLTLTVCNFGTSYRDKAHMYKALTVGIFGTSYGRDKARIKLLGLNGKQWQENVNPLKSYYQIECNI